MLAQHLAQRRVQQVGGRMVEHDRLPPRHVDAGRDHVTAAQRLRAVPAAGMAEKHAAHLQRVADLEAARGAGQRASIAHLPAGLGVERRAVEDQQAGLALGQLAHLPAFAHDAEHRAGGAVDGLVTLKYGRLQLARQFGRHLAPGLELARRAGALALLVHRLLEAGHVHREAAFARDVGGEIDRKTVGVVQPERIGAGNRLHRLRRHLVEHAHAVLQRLAEALLLGAQRILDERQPRGELRIGRAHLQHQRRDHLPEEVAAHAQHPAVAQRAPDDPAQHVAAAFVGRQHAIDDQERAGADVVGDHAQGLVGEVGGGGELARLADQVREQVDLVVGVHMLQHRGESLQAHAGIHARRRQRAQRAVGRAVELHEHQIPDLDVAVAVFIRRAGRAAGNALAVIVEDLRARAARAGVGHLPEIVRGERRALVVADAHDALGRHAHLLVPDLEGLVIGVIHGDPQLVGRQLEHAGQQLPGKGNRVALEVVAERPVAEHLEERVVARGVTHRVQIVVLAAGAQAALHVRGPHVTRLFAAEKHVLERHHARVGEQQGRVAGRHQRAGRHDGVALGTEVVEEGGTDIGGFHADRAGGRRKGHTAAPPRDQSEPSAASSTSVWVTFRTVAAAKPRRKRNCARRLRSAGSAVPTLP